MEEKTENGYSRRKERYYTIAAAVIIAATAMLFAFYPAGLGKKQPIPFSHRLHSGKKEISCVFCHDSVLDSASAGIPPLQRCMLCHEKIIIHYPPVEELRTHYKVGEPVEWERINALPDHVQFHHGVHISAGHDCGQCHGDVAAMDRVVPENEFDMGFCIQCHRDRDASIDCLNCHH
jgi:hypothetical protein